MARRIAYSGSFSGVDHERAAANEEILRPVFGSIILTAQDVPQSFAPIQFGWGGEVLANFTITAALITKSRVAVWINGKLYEGDNEAADPSQLEDEKVDDLVVPKGGNPVPFAMTLFNDGVFGGGGDSATLSLTFTNNIVEEDDEDEVRPQQNINIRLNRNGVRLRAGDAFAPR